MASAAESSSPFQSLDKWDDAPLPPIPAAAVEGTAAEQAAGVAAMIDSPFASSLIAPGLMEQLSQSIVASGKSEQASSSAMPSDPPVGRASGRSEAPSGATSLASGKTSEPRLQGVASILESPFSQCLTHDLQQLNLGAAGSSKATGTA